MITTQFGADDFLKSMKAARKKFASDVLHAVREATEKSLSHARSTDKFEDETGALRASIKASYPGQYEGKVDATARHAHWVERGNGPPGGFIYPKRAPFLVFTWRGQKFVTRRVRTSKPRLFMEAAAREGEREFDRLCHLAASTMFG